MDKTRKPGLFPAIAGILFLSYVFSAACLADQVILKNGDRLTGKIVKAVEKKLTLKSDLAGEVIIPMENIQTFSSDEPVELHFQDGTVSKQKIEQAPAGQIVLSGSQTLQKQTTSLSNLSAVNPPKKEKSVWKGSVSAGLTYTSGNTSNESYSASIDLQKRTENDRITLTGDLARSKQKSDTTGEKETTEDWWKLRAKYDYFLSKKFFLFGEGRYELDKIANLDRRVILGGGGGYQWIESDDMNFSTEFGLASVYEKFEDSSDSNSEMSIQAGYHFDKKLNSTIQLLHDLTYYPSMDEFSDYYLTTSAELRANLTDRMFANLTAILDFDKSPAPDKGTTDTKYLFGIGWDF